MFTATDEQKRALANAFKKFDHTDPSQRRSMAEKLVNFVVTDVYTQSLVSMVADMEDFDADEVLQYHTLRPVKAYILDPGSSAKRQRIIKDSVTLPENRVYVGTTLDLRQLRSGRFGTINDYRRLVGEALLGEQNKQIWDTLNNSITSSDNDSNYATFASGAAVATKKSALDAAIDYVRDNTNGMPAGILARYTAVSWIYQIADQSNVTTFPEMTKEEIQRRGWIASYRGVPVFYLRNYKDVDGVAKVGSSDIHVVSSGTLKFARMRPGLESFNNIDGSNFSWNIDFWETYGSLVVETNRNYRINIS